MRVENASSAAVSPDLNLGPAAHPLAEELYEALRASPEGRFYTPAVWQRARLNTLVLSDWLYSEKRSSMMYAAIQDDWKSLLVDAAEQRRLGIEVQAAVVDADEEASVTALDDYRANLGA